ncbi:MAG TPA: hypothetical protein VIV60_17975 [Polyangiaceae bacterium]
MRLFSKHGAHILAGSVLSTTLTACAAGVGDTGDGSNEATATARQPYSIVGQGTMNTGYWSLLTTYQGPYDADSDGLDDWEELSVADAFRPYVKFDDSEHARQWFEPITIFQVRPLEHRVDTQTVRIKYIFLFKDDGGYGPSSSCDDSHPGDNDNMFVDITSTDGGYTWTLERVNVGTDEWPTEGSLEIHEQTHPVVYLSGSKHHQYLNTYYDGRDSAYSDVPLWDDCDEDVNGLGAQFLTDVRSVGSLSYIGNNVGEPEAHPTNYFIDDLSAYFPDQSVWGSQDFYGESAGPNWKKINTFPKPPDNGPLSSNSWSIGVSEETNPAYCAKQYMMGGVYFSGSYSDSTYLYCIDRSAQNTATGNRYSTWLPWFSEESPNSQQCPGDTWVSGMRCRGSYCDDVQLLCTQFIGKFGSNCSWTAAYSEESGARFFPSGYFAKGARCTGSYCDNMSFYLCQD